MLSNKEDLGLGNELVKVLLPPAINNSDKKDKTIFLAGPIQGSKDWQEKAIDYLIENNKDKKKFNIASPRKEYKPKDFQYDKQVEWETSYLNKASENGIIIFWLAKEHEHDPKRSYAQTSRFELAEWLVKQSFDKNIQILIGIEEGFSGEKYIIKKVKDEYETAGKIYSKLEDLLKVALEKI